MGQVVKLDDRRRREAPPPMPGDELDGVPPPHDLGAEEAVLSAALLAPDGESDAAKALRASLERVHELVGVETFHATGNGLVWQAIAALRASSTPVDPGTVASWLRERDWLGRVGGAQRLLELTEAATAPGNVESHARTIRELWERRDVIATCLRVQAEARATVEDHEAAKRTWRRELGRATAPRQELAGRPIGAVVAEVRGRQAERARGLVTGVRWGFSGLDGALGMLVRGHQHVLAGESEHGKTSLAWQVGINVADTPADELGVREAVYWMTGEMRGRELLERGACSMAAVDALAYEAGHATADELARVGSWLDFLERLPIVVDDDPAPPAELARRIRAHKEAFAAGRARDGRGDLLPVCRMQLAIGDHLQRLADVAHGCEPRADLRTRIAAVSHGWCVDIAQGEDVATLLLSQLKPADEQAMRRTKGIPWPRVGDLWGGNAIRADADVVAAVCRPELLLRGKELPEKWLGRAAFLPLKGRFGGSRRLVPLTFDRGLFGEISAAEAAFHNFDEDR